MSQNNLYLALLIAQVILVAAFLVRSDKRLSDYPAFYAATRLWQKGEQPYNLDLQCREQAPFHRSECLPFAHPPVLLQLQSAITSDSYSASYWRWVGVLLAVLLMCAYPLSKLTPNTPTTAQALLWQPVVASMWIGQDTAFIVASIIFWFWLFTEKKKYLLSGLALSLTVIKPHFAIALGLPLLVLNRHAFAGFCLGGLTLTLYCFALVGLDGFRGIIRIASVMSQGVGFGIWAEGYANIAGIFVRNSIPLTWSWVFYPIGIVGVAVVWRRGGLTIETVTLALTVMLLTSPHVHAWDIAPLLLPLASMGMMPLLLSSLVLFVLMLYRLEHLGCYLIMFALLLYNSPQLIKQQGFLMRVARTAFRVR